MTGDPKEILLAAARGWRKPGLREGTGRPPQRRLHAGLLQAPDPVPTASPQFAHKHRSIRRPRMTLRSTIPGTPICAETLAELTFQKYSARNWEAVAGASERIRTVDLRIKSASSGNLPQSDESPESRNRQNIETSETEGNHQDPRLWRVCSKDAPNGNWVRPASKQ